MAHILFVDDIPTTCARYKDALEGENHKVKTANYVQEARDYLRYVKGKCDLIILDLDLPETKREFDNKNTNRDTGIKFLRELKDKDKYYRIPVIMLSAKVTATHFQQAIDADVFDFIDKTGDDYNVLFNRIENALQINSNIDVEQAMHNIEMFPLKSKLFRNMIEIVRKIAPTDANILLTGETGTGKNLIAELIHELDLIRVNPLVDCTVSALTPELIESELFGSVKGSFTGSIKDKMGFLEKANGTTLLLDEIADIPLNIQVKLLRVLQSKKYEKVGEPEKTLESTFRLISATNKNIAMMGKNGEFREDLYYRINVIEIQIPPLRDRKEDVFPLARHFLSKINRQKKKKKNLLPECDEVLQNYNWPGNIRQLENFIENCHILSDGESITANFLQRKLEHMISLDQSEKPDIDASNVVSSSVNHLSASEYEDLNGNLIRYEEFELISLKKYLDYAFEEKAKFNKTKLREITGVSDDFLRSRGIRMLESLENVEELSWYSPYSQKGS
jgi:DNA-binding NtrC family response regulator